jgi:hypothetical protein
MLQPKPGDRIQYIGEKDRRHNCEPIWGVPLVVHTVKNYYLSAVLPDGRLTSWIDFTDVILDEEVELCVA